MIISLAQVLPPGSCGLPVSRSKRVPSRLLPEGNKSSSPIQPCSKWGLPCVRRRRRTGELLPRLFTLIGAVQKGNKFDRSRSSVAAIVDRGYRFWTAPTVCFLWHFPSPPIPRCGTVDASGFRSTRPCGVRTFLSFRGRILEKSDHPSCPWGLMMFPELPIAAGWPTGPIGRLPCCSPCPDG